MIKSVSRRENNLESRLYFINTQKLTQHSIPLLMDDKNEIRCEFLNHEI